MDRDGTPSPLSVVTPTYRLVERLAGERRHNRRTCAGAAAPCQGAGSSGGRAGCIKLGRAPPPRRRAAQPRRETVHGDDRDPTNRKAARRAGPLGVRTPRRARRGARLLARRRRRRLLPRPGPRPRRRRRPRRPPPSPSPPRPRRDVREAAGRGDGQARRSGSPGSGGAGRGAQQPAELRRRGARRRGARHRAGRGRPPHPRRHPGRSRSRGAPGRDQPARGWRVARGGRRHRGRV